MKLSVSYVLRKRTEWGGGGGGGEGVYSPIWAIYARMCGPKGDDV